MIGLMKFFYLREHFSVKDDIPSPFGFLATVYQVADKYLMPQPKKDTLQRFRSLPKEPWDFDDFLEVTDDDGWTNVTSGSNVRRVVRTTKARSDRETNRVDETELFLSPAEAPTCLTFEELEAQYRGYKERWVQSETWQKPRVQLDQSIHDQETETSP
jgi:hypothetical protein